MNEILEWLLNTKMVCAGGVLQPEDIFEVGNKELVLSKEFVRSLDDFFIDEIQDTPFNGCAPVIEIKEDKCILMWIYGYEVKFGKMNVYTSAGCIDEMEFIGHRFKKACDYAELRVCMNKQSEE